MIFTVIGIIFRCLLYVLLWNSADKHPIICTVGLVVYIILCVIGVIETYTGRYSRPAISTVLLFIIQIAASIYFGFAAESLIGKIIGLIVVFLIFGGVMSLFPDNSNKSTAIDTSPLDAMDNFFAMNLEKVKQDQIAEREQRESENAQREKNVRDRWNSGRGTLNSDATYYQTSDGTWNKISSDGTRYEDSNGNWHNI